MSCRTTFPSSIQAIIECTLHLQDPRPSLWKEENDPMVPIPRSLHSDFNAQFAQSQRKRNGLRTIPKERRFCTESVPFLNLRCNALWDVRITLRYARTCWKGESGNQRFQPNARSKHARLSSTTHEREDQSLYPFSLTISLKACAFSSYSTSSLLRSPQIASLSSRTCFWRR